MSDLFAMPEEAKRQLGYELSKTRELTHAGNADRLVDLHGYDLIYVPGIGWHIWSGTRWEHNRGGELGYGCARRPSRRSRSRRTPRRRAAGRRRSTRTRVVAVGSRT